MIHLQEAFLNELKSNPKFTVAEYATLYIKHCKLAIEEQLNNGASQKQADAMGNYYTVTVLSGFLGNENKLDRIIALQESMQKESILFR